MPPILIVIVNWNSWILLGRCLKSLSKQTYKNFDIIIIDNCSDDNIPAGIQDYGPRITLTRNTSNVGFATANNQIIDVLNSDGFVVLLNPDAFPESQWLEMLINAAEIDPTYSVYGSRLKSAQNPQALDGDGDIYHISGLAWRDRRLKPAGNLHRLSRDIFSACAAAAMYRVDAIRSVGGFDEDFFCYMEDVDLGFRLRLSGHKALVVPDAIAAHLGSATTGGQKSDFAVYHGHRNLVWTYLKNMPGALLWIFLPLHCAINLLAVLWFGLRGQGRVILRAKFDALRGLPRMWRKRKRIQRQRVASVADILRAMDKSLIPLNRFSPGDGS